MTTPTQHRPFGKLVGGPLDDGAPAAEYPETFAVVKLRREVADTTYEYEVTDYIAVEHFAGQGFRVHEVVGVYAYNGHYEHFEWMPAEAFAATASYPGDGVGDGQDFDAARARYEVAKAAKVVSSL